MHVVKRQVLPNEGLDVATPCRVVNRSDVPVDLVIMAQQAEVSPSGYVPRKAEFEPKCIAVKCTSTEPRSS